MAKLRADAPTDRYVSLLGVACLHRVTPRIQASGLPAEPRQIQWVWSAGRCKQ